MTLCGADKFGRDVPTGAHSEKKERWQDVYETLGHFRNERVLREHISARTVLELSLSKLDLSGGCANWKEAAQETGFTTRPGRSVLPVAQVANCLALGDNSDGAHSCRFPSLSGSP